MMRRVNDVVLSFDNHLYRPSHCRVAHSLSSDVVETQCNALCYRNKDAIITLTN
jgi:hypothetical protein